MNAKDSEYPICRHTKTNGRRCQSPARSASAFCFFHQKLRGARTSTIGSGPGLSTHVLHPLRNAHSIQQALAMVVSGLAGNRIPARQAGRMLFALQIASSNLRARVIYLTE